MYTVPALCRSMLKLGSSKVFADAFEMVTGSRKLSAKPMVDYFLPLIEVFTVFISLVIDAQPHC